MTDLPRVRVPELELKQLLTEPAGYNALQFTAAGRAVRFNVSREESGVVIRVSDEGQGIEQELLPKSI